MRLKSREIHLEILPERGGGRRKNALELHGPLNAPGP
jgi:hypothetical protein